jgi:hypothetical protein
MKTVPGSDPNEMVIDPGYGLSPGLISPHLLTARAHVGVNTLHNGMRRLGGSANRGTPLMRALALHGVSDWAGSHLGSTLNPGRAVLTLGVFRRSRSVAYIRADASPNEVLASAIFAKNAMGVNPTWGLAIDVTSTDTCVTR